MLAIFASQTGDAGILSLTGTPKERAAGKSLSVAVKFARLVRDLAATCDGPKGKVRPERLCMSYPVDFILQTLADSVTTATEARLADSLVQVYRHGLDKKDAYPEYECLPFAYAEAVPDSGETPRVSDVQARLRAWGPKVDEDTLRKRMKSQGYKLRGRGRH